MTHEEIESKVRDVLAVRAQLPIDVKSVAANQSLYDSGMTSHATVKVMLGLEDRFDIEFPDSMLQRSVFDQISSIAIAIKKLLSER